MVAISADSNNIQSLLLSGISDTDIPRTQDSFLNSALTKDTCLAAIVGESATWSDL
jgi:hypothetical protein